MIVCIDGVLERGQLRSTLEAIQAAEFVDGRETAGFRAKRVKNNLQLKKQAPGAEEIKNSIVKALKRYFERSSPFKFSPSKDSPAAACSGSTATRCIRRCHWR